MATTIFSIFELSEHVFRYIEPRMAVGLMVSSREMFSLLAPVLWRSVRGAHQILALIVGTQITLNQKTKEVWVVCTFLRTCKSYSLFG